VTGVAVHGLVNLARYLLPFIDEETATSESVELVPPATFDHVEPPLVETSHCTVTALVPLAAALKLAFVPAHAV
jgi:hypothetical protein